MKRQLKFKDPRYLQKNHPWKEGGQSMESVKAHVRRMYKPFKRNEK